MKKFFLNLKIFNSRCNLFCRTLINSTPVWCIRCNTLNNLKSEINRKYFRCLHSSVTKFNDIDKESNRDSVIYYGTLTGKIKAVKVFSISTSVGGIIAQAWILQNASIFNNFSIETLFFVSIGFFTYITPLFIHMMCKKYVTEIRYDPTSDTYTATSLTFFLRPNHINFKREDVYVPTYQSFFATMTVKGRPVLISSDCFFDEQDYIKMMGYDKPIDLHMSPPPDGVQKTPGGRQFKER